MNILLEWYQPVDRSNQDDDKNAIVYNDVHHSDCIRTHRTTSITSSTQPPPPAMKMTALAHTKPPGNYCMLDIELETIQERQQLQELPALCWNDSDSSMSLSTVDEMNDDGDDGTDDDDDATATATTTILPTRSMDIRTNGHPCKRVKFHTHIAVREYSVTIGDHPCCDDALPITLDWAYVENFYHWTPANHDSMECVRTVMDTNDHRLEQRQPVVTSPSAHGSHQHMMFRPLTMAERRYRLIQVGAYTVEEIDNYLLEHYSVYSSIVRLLALCLPNQFKRKLPL
jgi:hypothetical protein